MVWRISKLQKELQKRFVEISTKRDWSWVAPENKVFETNFKRRRIIIKEISYLYRHSYIIEKLEAERLKYILIWISLVVEMFGIQEEIPRGVFEDICSYI